MTRLQEYKTQVIKKSSSKPSLKLENLRLETLERSPLKLETNN